MFKAAICLGLATLATTQWAFTVPDGDMGELAPGNNVRQGDIHNFKWHVGLNNQPVEVLDNDGLLTLRIGDVESSSEGTWAWDTGTLSDDDIDLCQGVFIYRLERPVSSGAATYDWDTDLAASSVSFRILKRSEAETTQAAPTTTSTESEEPVRQTTLTMQTTIATSFPRETTADPDSSTSESESTTSERADPSDTAALSPTDTSTSEVASPSEPGSSTDASSSSSATATNTPPASDAGLSAGIGIGAVAAAALVAIAGLLLYRRRGTRAHTDISDGLQPAAPVEKLDVLPQQQRENNEDGWADYPEVAAQQQQQYPGAPRTELMENRRHELPGAR
ncbi:hypothetical protein P171DRAFT_503010 [Karstenula rhodostoma CBS 690.94]|uniref:Mid2 domain-containing protein n=1 Tax=Karstenula rhodostoma CBS 690.94 TaxID=1392251 RepID=A0A9P4PX29_9PLEO|nr:hypothetical protein P171DRAFT_503010 [Karstenula rhodostoma CBS 690.94]